MGWRNGLVAFLAVACLAVSPAGYGRELPARADEAALVEHDHYVNADGEVVHSPAHTRDGVVPAGASARCRDGSYSFSRHRRGTCSGHGGVETWLAH